MKKCCASRFPFFALVLGLSLLAAGCGREEPPPKPAASSQAAKPTAPAGQDAANAVPPVSAPPAPGARPLSDMESLVAPVALYPDPLLAELLVAATYPLEVVQASRWLDSKPDLNTLGDKDWDASILRLTAVPQVLKMMSDHLDWTTQLGDTFLAQPDAVMNSIQDLRRRAKQSGFLKDTPEQKVSTKTKPVRQTPAPAAEEQVESAGEEAVQPTVVKQEVVYIEPAKDDTLYVPQYNPEAAYSAPLAPPPGSAGQYPAATTAGYAYPAAVPPATYYPAYYPAATTTTTDTSSTSNDLMTFGLGAVAGGLLTWGIMEWADDDDDWDDYYGGHYHPPVSHYYGDAVCRNGNCWNGGGNWDRGDVNYNRNYNREVNVSGNEINIDRSKTFDQTKLNNLKTKRQGWTPDTRHRRGVKYPEEVKKKFGQADRPALAGSRLGTADTLPADIRGFGGKGERPAGDRRPSADQIRQSLSEGKPLGDAKLRDKVAERPGQARPETKDIQRRLDGGKRPNALEDLGDSRYQAKLDERRGAESRQAMRAKDRPAVKDDRKELPRRDQARVQQAKQAKFDRNKLPEQRIERPRPQERRDLSQAREQQKRIEHARPNAFEGARQQDRTRDFSKRGAASRQQMASRGQHGGGAGFKGGGGGGAKAMRGGGGGARGGGGGGRARGRR